MAFALFQSSGTFPSCHELLKIVECSLTMRLTSFFSILRCTSSGTMGLGIHLTYMIPVIFLYYRYHLIPTVSVSKEFSGIWEAQGQTLTVKSEPKMALRNNAIIRNCQHGLTKGKSCLTNLVGLFAQWMKKCSRCHLSALIILPSQHPSVQVVQL